MWNVALSFFMALAVRLGLVAYGAWQDQTMLVRYTDVDYDVFTDAAEYVIEGKSPYDRATYRYTPLLAWMLTPNICLSPLFGKIIFVLCDIICGVLMYKMLKLRQCPDVKAHVSLLFWLFNPMSMNVSSRGNAESVVALVVLAALMALLKQRTKTAAFLYGLSVHVKIYPITYALPIYMLLDGDYKSEKGKRRQDSKTVSSYGMLVKILWPNKSRIQFSLIAAGTFAVFTALTYHLYGYKAIEETYLYHITRKDIRHNLSVYFYMLYLNAESALSWVASLAVFIPQAVLLIAVSLKYYQDISFCCFIHTFVFVTFNKVCTCQYFIWYLCLLPLVLPNLQMKIRNGLMLIALWFLSQAIWMYPAFNLEFEGQDTFLYIWMAGILFFAMNVFIMVRLFRCHLMFPTFKRGRLSDLGF
ncbi:GPI mannosyltransferase 1-like [Ptychodera flava]|uniref:GPI mannosyltransferase 1-like n=1 Tax=Ptychodera flava TaxID=63121 RepID=UPI00396A32BA